MLFYFFTRLCQGIDNCFYAFGNTRNTSKFEPFHIAQVTEANKSLIYYANLYFIYVNPYKYYTQLNDEDRCCNSVDTWNYVDTRLLELDSECRGIQFSRNIPGILVKLKYLKVL